MSNSRTGGQTRFATVPNANIQRSTFDRSCGLKTAFDSAQLVPIFCDEALPGDTMSLNLTTFGRMATPIHPVMDNIYMDTHFFAVPVRLLWENWERFNGQQEHPGDSTDFLVPQIIQTVAENSLSDYMGIPTQVTDLTFSALWHRAYNKIFNTWFRDENLQDSEIENMDDGPDDPGDYYVLSRGKRHDYFTSCLPFLQKGPAVTLPLGTSAPIIPDLTNMPNSDRMTFDFPTATPPISNQLLTATNSSNLHVPSIAGIGANYAHWNTTGLLADLTNSSSATINQLREAFQIQRLYERDARGGTRYIEQIKSHFGVTSPDARLQRPEYLGGGTATININPVPQTSETAGDPLGTLAAFGTVSSSGQGFRKSFTEHCIILGLVSVRADLNYQQGLERQWSRRTRFDFFWPTLAHIGEQAVLNKEIYAADDADQNDAVFGYQERYAEYRYKPSKVTGPMRSNAAAPLDTWHLAQDFSSLPVLGSTFIEENPPISRVVAVPSEPEFLLDCFFKFKHVRPMPTYGVPGMIDHF